jgi:hypothetical protein
MVSSDEKHIRELKTPNGWYLCVQLDDLQSVCEFLYVKSGKRYTRDFYPPELRLPFLIKDVPTEDSRLRMLQVIEFPQAQQVVAYDRSLRPGPLNFMRRKETPTWLWDQPPWPHLDESGYRQVCLDNAFYCASTDDQPMINRWFELSRDEYRPVYAPGFYATPMPYLIKVSRVEDYAVVTAIPTDDLICLVKRWQYYFGMRKMLPTELAEFSRVICRLIDNLILARWPITQELKKTPNTM